MSSETVTRSRDFFYEHAGYSYDPATETPEAGRRRGALARARAEHEAASRGWFYVWEPGDECTGCECGECQCALGEPHESYICILYDANEHVLQSLGSICEPDRNYMRVVEAELALEALAEADI